MIIRNEIDFLREFETLKCDLFPRISREKIKRLIRAIKKTDNLKSSAEFKSDNLVTFQEMKTFLKKMKKTPEHRMNSLCRKLSLAKEEGFISLEQFEFWFRSWTKMKNEDGTFFDKENKQKTLFEELSAQIEQVEV